ncbi:MAG: glycyl-radical enzyme activating protein [Chloroflexota bacterium]
MELVADITQPIEKRLFLEPSGKIFDIKRYSINDGPGIRTTVFFSGCPLDCRWCHNPEGRSRQSELLYRACRCIRCGACAAACPEGAIKVEAAILTDRAACIGCQSCIDVCFTDARQFAGRSATITQVMAIVLRDMPFYEESDGGATFSGGEPLGQLDFLAALLKSCRENGIHTIVDTSGYAGWDAFERILRDVDIFLYDIKLMDDCRHQEVAGVSNRLILENLRKLSASGARIVVRMPLVPGINDGEENTRQLGIFLSGLPLLPEVEILPYHASAEEKYAAMDREYRLAGLKPPNPEQTRQVESILRSYRLNVHTSPAARISGLQEVAHGDDRTCP